jgi:hypothetical protein
MIPAGLVVRVTTNLGLLQLAKRFEVSSVHATELEDGAELRRQEPCLLFLYSVKSRPRSIIYQA